MQIEEEHLPSTSNKLKQFSEIDEHNFTDEEYSNDSSTPINSRSSKLEIYFNNIMLYQI